MLTNTRHGGGELPPQTSLPVATCKRALTYTPDGVQNMMSDVLENDYVQHGVSWMEWGYNFLPDCLQGTLACVDSFGDAVVETAGDAVVHTGHMMSTAASQTFDTMSYVASESVHIGLDVTDRAMDIVLPRGEEPSAMDDLSGANIQQTGHPLTPSGHLVTGQREPLGERVGHVVDRVTNPVKRGACAAQSTVAGAVPPVVVESVSGCMVWVESTANKAGSAANEMSRIFRDAPIAGRERAAKAIEIIKSSERRGSQAIYDTVAMLNRETDAAKSRVVAGTQGVKNIMSASLETLKENVKQLKESSSNQLSRTEEHAIMLAAAQLNIIADVAARARVSSVETLSATIQGMRMHARNGNGVSKEALLAVANVFEGVLGYVTGEGEAAEASAAEVDALDAVVHELIEQQANEAGVRQRVRADAGDAASASASVSECE